MEKILTRITPTLVKYLISGGLAMIVKLAVLYALTEYVGIWYLLSSAVAFFFAWLVAFTLQKFWTFKNTELSTVHIQLSRHFVLSLVNVVLNVMVLFVLVEALGVWYIFAQLIASASIASMNYFVYRRYIFPRSEEITPLDMV